MEFWTPRTLHSICHTVSHRADMAVRSSADFDSSKPYSAENIGRLFRTRFKGSQFIVVSLKDGLFSNANGKQVVLPYFDGADVDYVAVLFRARFRDGTSIVERTAQRSSSALYSNDKENGSGAATGKGKAAAGGGRNRAALTAH